MDAAQLIPGEVVTLHVASREHRARYLCHDDKRAVVELSQVETLGVSNPVVVRWDDLRMWISDRVTDRAYFFNEDTEVMPVGVSPDRE